MQHKRVLSIICAGVLGVLAVPPAWADTGELPLMSRSEKTNCLRDEKGRQWRVQCDEAAKVCLYAPNSEVDEEGNWVRPLERASRCSMFTGDTFDRTALEAAGFKLVAARADVPFGWMRDERGRVFQVNFDLKRRLYFGVSYSPQRRADGTADGKRLGMDFGLFSLDYYTGGSSPTRHRLRLVEGEVFLSPFSGTMQLFHYDLSRRYKNPLLRITTFFGKPRRSDLKLNLGVSLDGGGLEVRQTASGADERHWSYGTAQATFDVWQSSDLYSFVRLRAGAGIEEAKIDGGVSRAAVAPSGAVEADLTLDDSGFHHLGAEISYARPYYFTVDPMVGDHAYRFAAKAEYEVIFVAINDQPLSLHLAAGVEKRNDRPDLPSDLAFVGTVGLRFSLWAPPRQPTR